MYYLESRNLVHRDISYTNILLRSPAGKGSDSNSVKRREIMNELGLSEIEELRTRYQCREGLLIDFDYAAPLNPSQVSASDVVSESRVESGSEIQSSHHGIGQFSGSQGSGQGSGQDSGQSSSQEEDFEVVDNEDNKTIIQRIAEKASGRRTVSYF
jgi:serine/threonine protein kinase